MVPGKRVYVTGSVDELGPQEDSQALPLNPVGGCVWSGDLTVPSSSFPFTYRYSQVFLALPLLTMLSWCTLGARRVSPAMYLQVLHCR